MKPTKSLPFLAIVAIATAAGCQEAEIPEQLESLSVTAVSGAGGASSSTELAASGMLAVTGSDRDFHLDVDAGALELDIHLPGMSDLSILTGREVHVAVSHDPGPIAEQVTITIEDGSGPLFVASNQPNSSPFIGWGEVVAEEDLDGAVWGYTTTRVHQDAQPLELMPGDVANATIEGASWRVASLAAHRIEDDSDYEFDCILPPDVLAFEMLRVDEPAEPERVARPAALPMVRATSCE